MHTPLHILFLFLIACFPLISPATELNKPNIQLASVYAEPDNIQHYWVSEKLDGVRGYWNGVALYTRQGHIINPPKYFVENWPNVVMDGELWIARGQFDAVSALIRTTQTKPEQWRVIKFMIFDLPEHKGDFSARIQAMQQIINTSSGPHLSMVEQVKVESIKALNMKLTDITANGGEGLMLHHSAAYYQVGRTDNIMKLKTYLDAEAKVVEYIEGKGKYQNMLGSILVETIDGIRFKIGSGFTDEQRKNPPPIGSIITFKYYGKTKFNVPRFASFIRVREDN